MSACASGGSSHETGAQCLVAAMTESLQPTSGSLSAKVIRACTVHTLCPLTCPRREVEDLGEIATFQVEDESHPPSIIQRIKEVLRL